MVFSNGQILEIPFGKKNHLKFKNNYQEMGFLINIENGVIKCQITIAQKFIAINSNSLSNVQIIADSNKQFSVPELQNIAFCPNKFEINICKSR